jgi:hypothetical protein
VLDAFVFEHPCDGIGYLHVDLLTTGPV